MLLRKNGGGRGERFALPGGAQDLGETLEQALNRECEEEIGTRVEVLDLLHVADFFKAKFSEPPGTRHLVEFLFLCRVADDYVPINGPHPDKNQIEVIWADLNSLESMTLFPESMTQVLGSIGQSGSQVYLGPIR